MGKSGTTTLVSKVAGGLPNCRAFSGGQPGKHIGNYENAVYKHTYEERKGKSFELYREHLEKEKYDRKIWIARDPRDAAVSRMLYRWHKGHRGNKKQYETHIELVLKKEKDRMIRKSKKRGFGNWKKYRQNEEDFYDALREIEKPFHFIDLSNVFLDSNETLYVDYCHYNDLAAEKLAEKIFESIEPLLLKINAR
jgi:hypothetical protein